MMLLLLNSVDLKLWWSFHGWPPSELCPTLPRGYIPARSLTAVSAVAAAGRCPAVWIAGTDWGRCTPS